MTRGVEWQGGDLEGQGGRMAGELENDETRMARSVE